MSIASDVDIRSRIELVRSFACLGRDDVAYAGGKGANLGELISAGLPVPEGLVAATEQRVLLDAAHQRRVRP
jgi:hypothetical protein